MAVRYVLYQDNRAESKNRGKWYARAVYSKKPKTLKLMAAKIQENVSVKASDVKAVLEEMVNVLKEWLQDSNRVVQDRPEDQARRHRQGLECLEAPRRCTSELPS